nr:hypothetical protein [Pseudosulfitobacter pseudonitzschiae]
MTLEALMNEGLVTILSEPNLTARSGDKASFLAGGRFPYQTQAGDGEVRVVFEPFGVELDFEPEVQRSDKIKLVVNTKIRELDFSKGSTTDLQNLPLILERSAATTIEVSSGQSFAIAGLFKATSQQNIKQIPGLGKFPSWARCSGPPAFRRERPSLSSSSPPIWSPPAHRASSRHRWTNSHLRTGLAAPSGAS